MLPVLFHVGSVPIHTHDSFVMLGTLVATGVFVAEAHRRRMWCEQLLWVVIGSLFCGALAARSGWVWEHLASERWATTTVAAKSILGGLTGAYIGAVATKKLVGYRFRTGDLFAPAVAAGMAVGRWGCYLTETAGVPRVELHFSFLWEIAFHCAAFAALMWLRPYVHVPGELLKVYLLGYGLFRFGIEFVRGNDIVLGGLTRSQLFLIPTGLLLVVYFLRQFRGNAYGMRPGMAT